MTWTNTIKQTVKARRAGLVACALAFTLAWGVAAPAPALADVRKADVVYGQTVEARDLSVAQ